MSIFQNSAPNQVELAQCDQCGEMIGISADNWHDTCPRCGTASNNWTFISGMRAPNPRASSSSSSSTSNDSFSEFCIKWFVRLTVAYFFYWYFFS